MGVKGLGTDDARAALSDEAFWAITGNNPMALLLDESDHIPSYQGGNWWRNIVAMIFTREYQTHWATYNARRHELPKHK